MKAHGIRISDKINRIVCVELPEILKEIKNGDILHWSILHFNASGRLGEGKSISVFTKQINESEKGMFIEWDVLNTLSHKLFEVIDLLIIGCKDINLLKRYKNDQEMYETCDIIIEMIDSGYWEVFSKDKQLIDRLASKFKDIKFLEPNFDR